MDLEVDPTVDLQVEPIQMVVEGVTLVAWLVLAHGI